MSRDPYGPLVRDYFANPRHAGDLENAVSVETVDQGVRLRLQATIKEGSVRALRFRAWGCPHLIAACESFCADYEGRTIGALSAFRVADIMQKLSVPVEKTGRILVLEDTVRSLGQAVCDASVPAQP